MRVAGSSLLCSRLSFADACEHVAARGFEAVDIGAMAGWAHIEPAAVLDSPRKTRETIERVCTATDLDPVAFNASAGTEDRGTERDRLVALAELADVLDIASMTIQGASSDTPLEEDLARCRDLAAALESFSVVLSVETHWGTHLEDPQIARQYAMIDGLELTLDPSHYVIGSYQLEDMEPLLPAVDHLHLRQAGNGWEQIQLAVDAGAVDIEGVLTALAAVGFDGVAAVEYIDSVGDADPTWVETQAATMRARIEAWTAC